MKIFSIRPEASNFSAAFSCFWQTAVKILPLIVIVISLTFLLNSRISAQDREKSVNLHLEKEINSSLQQDLIYDFYERRDYAPLWVDGNKLTETGEEVYAIISQAQKFGLNPGDYNYDKINDLWLGLRYQSPDEFPPAQAAELEIIITEGLVNLTGDLARGRLNPDSYTRRMPSLKIAPEVSLVFSAAREEENLTEVLNSIQPRHPQYQKLLEINQAVQQGEKNLTPKEENILAANLEKWRWAGENSPGTSERHVYVNLPSFTAQVYEDSEIVLDMKTIIGRRAHPTPEMNKILTHLTISPRWYMPRSIALRDHLPKIKEDQDHLERGGYRVYQEDDSGRFVEIDPDDINWDEKDASNFDYYLWQDAGPDNALGRVVFRFPNHQSIYLHDTPDRHLFNLETRAESSGCIRINKPMELTSYLLQDQAHWDLKRINDKIRDRQETTIYINNPIPIHLSYFTAGVSQSGELEFYDDIYNRMTDLKNVLERMDD